MPMRQKFDRDLEDLRLNILDLGKMVDNRISSAVKSLLDQDLTLANKVISDDSVVNDLQAKIEEHCIRLIATQQPYARDLRKVVAGLKIAIYLERMGDLSVDLAKLTNRIGQESLIMPLMNIQQMSAKVKEMLDLGLKAYVQEDCDAAASMAIMDDEVDKIYSQAFEDLKGIMMSKPEQVHQANYLLFACRFLERFGDYCTNISEEIVYLCSGKRVNLND
ncbi:phosphate uptake regulator, PhoU [Desulfosporosinus acidiphilus SJ4]|uniref:Phosphate-specific transport system accessory protein PhoU n=1 Tax=Desulfosporosinus acidiphilus (strain DSM 22704 / JCM 16185 / SJ4) TaxID=646529 RepID=I4D7S0_DESAJ|nr:phosphate signaling complex protein PhoU [Desulfosporosinus acidiphilus]AFM41844.1 phosphate uptake regulator, PhoU [Desulfosporosinus acidiphilus SJ4]